MVVWPTGKALTLARINNIRMVAEDARLPRVKPTGPISWPGIPKLNRVKPAAMMVVINIACPASTVVGFFSQAGGAIILTATFYFTEYILNSPGSEAIVVGLFMLAATLSIPGWIFVAKRIDKIKLWIGANIAAATLFCLTILLGEGDVVPMAVLATIAGLAAGAIIMINPAALADTISHGATKEAQGREGTYFALYTFMNKSAMGFSAAIIGIVLWMGGYVAKVEQSYESALAIRSLYAFGPATAFFIAAFFLARHMHRKNKLMM